MEVESRPVFNYVVTAHKPTAVIKSVVGNFTSPNDVNLIVAKCTRLEVHTSTATGLQGVLDVPLYGRISGIELFRPKGRDTDLLFVLLERLKFCVLEYDQASGELVSKAGGDVRDAVGRPVDAGHLVAVDPQCRLIALHLYDGMLKVLPLDPGSGRVSEAFNVRLEELNVVALAALAGCERPTLAVLYEDARHARHLKAYAVSVRDKDLVEVATISAQNLDPGAGLLVPLPAPLGGVVVLGESVISYIGASQAPRSVPTPRPTIMKAAGRIDADGSRHLLSDHQGLLYLLVLAHDGKHVAGLKLEVVGRTSSASSLCYLDAGVVYVGSRQGDSHLIRLHASPPNPAVDPHSYVEILESYPNLGPIVDFCVVDLDRQGQGQVVAASGALSDGAVRVIRNGIGINEQATIELPGIKGVWSLRPTSMDAHDKYLVLSFVGETRLLAINEDEELDEAEVAGFEAHALTLWCGNVAHDQLAQVTAAGVRLVDCHSQQLVAQWSPPGGGAINMAAGSPTQIVVAAGGGSLHLLEVAGEGQLVERASFAVGAEVACCDVTPIGEEGEAAAYVAVGTWSMEALVLRVAADGLAPVTREQLPGEVIPRSILMASFEGNPYLLAGLGDGTLLHWRLDAATGALSERKKMVLGTKPVMLRPFRGPSAQGAASTGASSGGVALGSAAGGTSVFAASDRPTVVYSSHKKLMFSNLNESEVTFMAPFNSASFPDSLAIAKEGSLTIGTVDAIQKLHVRTVPLGEQPRRITHQEATRTFGVITITNMGLEDESNHVRILDDTTLDTVASLSLEPYEMGCAITSAKLGDDPATYYVVGTAVARPEEPEPTKGRLLVLAYEEGRLSVVAEREVRGAAYEVLPFQGGRLLSSCNNKVQLHRWMSRADGSRELQTECSHALHVLSLYLAARGDHILVGDLMRSLSLLLFKQEEGALELRAQDYASNWCTAVAMLDDDTYLAAENAYNLFVVRKNLDATSDEERQRLELVGEFHLGEFVNRFRPGCLVMRLPDSELSNVPTLLYGTIDGSLGMIASLPPHTYEFCGKLQDALRKVVRGVGGLDHAEWRAFANERRSGGEARAFVDGDLVEAFLELGQEEAAKVVGLMGGGLSVEEVTRRGEELARLH
uniref:DNA damage-binding protein 1 n=1 Tax=Chlamydomonas leiostraca TaxID=1034604 RepID=A0A7S0WJG8_9CHLO|mmetsp:Transcript_15624/g.38892  ORF Transcript_15624/g.38892 Transcript_15624/m.38892 type:complete len:1127 (+) Transcript_15624:98-3478(+)